MSKFLCGCGQDRQTILSLDGGGIRGYGSTFILEELMKECHHLERQYDHGNGISTKGDSNLLPLPSLYFDYAAGTSTGGLIAIMVGRLRMSVVDAQVAYKRLGAEIFAHKRWWRTSDYDYRILERSIQTVIEKYSPERNSDLGMLEPPEPAPQVTPRCQTILYSTKKEGKNKDKTYVFRSYKHGMCDDPNFAHTPSKHRNANDELSNSALVWQAARATSAAPTYFKTQEIDTFEFMDGGIESNNPTLEAWHEAHGMHELDCIDPESNPAGCKFGRHGRTTKHQHKPCQDRAGGISIVVSIGTGRGDLKSIFTKGGRIRQMIKVVSRSVQELTNPTQVHENCETKASDVGATYFRFNVERGLEGVKMDDLSRLEYIRETTQKWFSGDGIPRQQLQQCARELVHSRRARCPPGSERYVFNEYWKASTGPANGHVAQQHDHEGNGHIGRAEAPSPWTPTATHEIATGRQYIEDDQRMTGYQMNHHEGMNGRPDRPPLPGIRTSQTWHARNETQTEIQHQAPRTAGPVAAPSMIELPHRGDPQELESPQPRFH